MTSTASAPPPTGQIPVVPFQPSVPVDAPPCVPGDAALASLIAGHLEALRSRGADQSVIDLLAAELRGITPNGGERRTA